MAKPKELFWVEKVGGGRLPYQAKGGGKFTDLDAAKGRRFQIIRRVPDAVVKIYRAETVWVEVELP